MAHLLLLGAHLFDLELTLLLLDAIAVLAVDVRGLNLRLKRASRQFVHCSNVTCEEQRG